MIKKFGIIILGIFTICISGCTQKFYLDQQYYNQDGKFINLSSSDFEDFDTQNYVLFVYNNYCAFSVPCDEIFKQYMEQNNINFLSMSYEEFKNTEFHKIVDFAPSVIIVMNGRIVDYLDSEKDKYLDMYQNVEKFGEWFEKYVYIDNQVE